MLNLTLLKKYSILFFTVLFMVSVIEAQNQKRNRHRQHGMVPPAPDTKLNIVCSFSDFATIAEYITGDLGEVSFIAHGEQDPHFVPPKPSYAMKLRKADLWITTGMDLEVWAPTLLDKARNGKIMDGEVGFVSVSDGVDVLQKVDKADRTEGDVHLMGNPHINTGPLNWKIIAENITIGLIKVNPENAKYYEASRDEFIDEVNNAMFGEELVQLFGGEKLDQMLRNKTLFTFLEKEYKGEQLVNKLGGWLKKALPFRGKKIIVYHKNWAYFTDIFGLEIVGYIEPKPGIPPSAQHVQNVVNLIEEQQIKLMLVASYFEKQSPKMIESKTGIKALFLPLFVSGAPGIEDNFQLVDYWIDQINTNIQ